MTAPDPYAERPARDTHFPPSNPFAVVALVCGIAGIAIGVVPLGIGLLLGFVPTVLAVALGIAAVIRAVRVRFRLTAAVVGLALGVLTVILWFHGYGLLW